MVRGRYPHNLAQNGWRAVRRAGNSGACLLGTLLECDELVMPPAIARRRAMGCIGLDNAGVHRDSLPHYAAAHVKDEK
jgi:hypothetical protein